MKPLSVLVVDDEPLARETVCELLARDDEVELVGECGDGASALRQIRDRHPDIVFLDIEMPAKSGLAVLDELGSEERPVVVYLTAYDDHAVEAYGLEALDYVLKPFSDGRFFEALERAKRRVRESSISALASTLAAPQGQVPREDRAAWRYLDRISVRRGHRLVLLPVDKVRWIESQDYYARLHTDDESYLLRASLTSLSQRLNPADFMRVHRTAVVRRDVVRELKTLATGVRALVLDDGTELRVSRAKAREVGAWLLQEPIATG